MVAKKAAPARISLHALEGLLSAFRMVGAKAGRACLLGVPEALARRRPEGHSAGDGAG